MPFLFIDDLCLLSRPLVHLLSCVQLFATLWAAACQAVFHYLPSLLRFMSIESVMSFNHLILYCPLLLLLSVFPSIRVFSSESALHIRWPEYWSFSFSSNPSSEYLGLISLRIDWFDLLTFQGTLKTFPRSSPAPQFKRINSSVLSPLYGPILTSIHDYWKNNSFDYMDLCWQSNVSDF